MQETNELHAQIENAIANGDSKEFVIEFCRTFELIERFASTVDLNEAYVLLSELAFATVRKLEEVN